MSLGAIRIPNRMAAKLIRSATGPKSAGRLIGLMRTPRVATQSLR